VETKKSNWNLSQKLLALSFILLLVAFVFYKIFGEPPQKYHSLGWYVFLITTLLCGLSFMGFWIAFIAEMIASNKKKHKIIVAKREDVMKRWDWIKIGSIFSAIILLVVIISLSAGFEVDPFRYPFQLSNTNEIIIFICEIAMGLSILLILIASVARFCLIHKKNEP